MHGEYGDNCSDVGGWVFERAQQAQDGGMLDRYHATCDDLIRLILKQRDALADRERDTAAMVR